MSLDDHSLLTQHDPMGMASLTADFADQCERTLALANEQVLNIPQMSINNVVIAGLGGSAAGGDLLTALLADQGKLPGAVNRDYSVPAYVDQSSLVFATSYSGNTEETLSAYADARLKGASIIVVSSGGKLSTLAKADKVPVISVPGGQPPRTALGYMFIPLVVASAHLGLIPSQNFDDVLGAIRSVASSCGFNEPEASNPAKQLARALSGKMTVVYGAGAWQFAIAQRWRGQINENSKEMVLTHYFPELCHNEILGWEGAHQQGVSGWETVTLWGGDEPTRLRQRIEITKRLVGSVTTFHDVHGAGKSRLAQMLSLAHFGDWVSLYLAALAGRDPGRMVAIDQLKDELSRLD